MGKRKTEQRIKAIELHKQGFSRGQIAERVGVSQYTVKTWIALYKNGQKDLLEDRPHTKSYSQKLKIAAVQAHIRGIVRHIRYKSFKTLVQRIQRNRLCIVFQTRASIQ